MGSSRAAARRALLEERRAKILRLRVEGKTPTVIAEIMGMSPSHVVNDITRALRDRREERGDAADDHTQLELERLDALYDLVWQVLVRKHPYVSGGTVVTVRNELTGETAQLQDDGPTLAAVDRLLKIAERRARLLGLDRPDRLEATIVAAEADSALDRLRAVVNETSDNQAGAVEALARTAPSNGNGNGQH